MLIYINTFVISFEFWEFSYYCEFWNPNYIKKIILLMLLKFNYNFDIFILSNL